MPIIKRLAKIIFLITLFLLFMPNVKEKILKEKIDYMIDTKKIDSIYEGYLYIPKFNYKNIIKKDIKSLEENNIVMMDYSDKIGGSTIVLAGHNNRYVFHKLYYLEKGDEVILSDFGIDYKYIVDKTKYINVDDFNELKIDNSLILITCSNNNQKRYIVILKHIV